MHTQSRVRTTHRNVARFLPVVLLALIGLNACQTTPTKTDHKPFGGIAQAVPGVIQAENFDEGGEGVSFHRNKQSTISGPTSRNADVQSNSEGGLELVGLEKGDWFEYTINVSSGGQHDLSTRLKSPVGSGFLLKLDGNDLGARIPTPYQGNADWIEIKTNGLEVPAGEHRLRITFDGSIANFDQFEFKRITQPAIQSVAINPAGPISASVDKDVPLSTILTGDGAFDRGLTWKVQPATNVTLTQSGESATFRASTAGTYTVSATSTSDSSKKSSVTVNASVIQAQSPAAVGQWGPVFSWPIVAIHAVVLPNGKIVTWSSSDKGDGYTDAAKTIPRVTETDTWLWDPVSDPNSIKQSKIVNTHTNMFCAGHSLLPDGKLLVVGGHIENLKGFAHTNIFDFNNSTWTPGPNTNRGRWYPTTAVLGNGDVLIANGFNEVGDGNGNGIDNPIPQVWQTASSTLRTLSTANLGGPYYPMLYQLADGRVFNAGPQPIMQSLNPNGTGQWTQLQSRDSSFRAYGSSVMFKPGQILITGGYDNPPTSSASIIDTTTATPTVTTPSPMNVARRQHNMTLLPNGEIIVTGGTSGSGFNDNTNPVYYAESWNPDSKTFKKLSSMAVRRLYHSTALLLPDGRILSAGGGGACNKNEPQDILIYGPCSHPDAEIYTPAYLFNPAGDGTTLAIRPVITAAPTSITYGSQFSFSTNSDIAKATLIKLSSVTHSQNFDQRIHDLTPSMTKTGQSYTVTAPINGDTMQPGYYLLFGLNAAGVPSVGKILKLN
jgi:Domain of unknown function (DUF1929)/Carbohydrate binding module (family 6)